MFAEIVDSLEQLVLSEAEIHDVKMSLHKRLQVHLLAPASCSFITISHGFYLYICSVVRPVGPVVRPYCQVVLCCAKDRRDYQCYTACIISLCFTSSFS